MEMDENTAARDGKFADAPNMEGRDTLIKERLDQQAEDEDDTDKHGNTGGGGAR